MRVTSAMIAPVIGANQVTTREIVADLARAGILFTRTGRGGSVALARPPAEITLAAIFDAVVSATDMLGGRAYRPSPDCAVGKRVQTRLDRLAYELTEELRLRLSRITIDQVLQG